ncbi:MAG: hypothetical protein QG652_186, partial [Pseudomonadota bacterium]|nr:hypothetical protein [Pseudomonadota bacterium]
MFMKKNHKAVRWQQNSLPALFLYVFFATAHAAEYYAINIGSSPQQTGSVAIQDQALAKKYVVYSVKSEVNGGLRYRQRIGFFASQEEARTVLTQIRKQFPDAWIDKASTEEMNIPGNRLAVPVATELATTPPAPVTKPVITTANKTQLAETEKNLRLAALMEDAKASLIQKKYDRAIQIYTRVTGEGESPYQKEAQEFLGVARERNGQLAHATAEYRKYLALYPAGEDTERVRQRLNGLLTAADKPQARTNNST